MRAAVVQLNTQNDKAANFAAAERWVREAASQGAIWVGLPETFGWLGPEAERTANAEPLAGETAARFSKLAKELNIELLAGSLLETGASDGRLFNTSLLFGPDGALKATYRKMHLFDVDVGDGHPYRESAAVAPGEQPVVVDSKLGRLGLSICYDLRFPELYRVYASQGATALAVPAAFTLATGKDHWEVLLRARAIENQSYVLAPAQWGKHPPSRMTFGNAMIVDPWGTVIARAPEGEGFAMADVDLVRLASVRASLPALRHRRLPG